MRFAGKHGREELVDMTVATRDHAVATYAKTHDIDVSPLSFDNSIMCMVGIGIIEGEHVSLYPRDRQETGEDAHLTSNCLVLSLSQVLLVAT